MQDRNSEHKTISGGVNCCLFIDQNDRVILTGRSMLTLGNFFKPTLLENAPPAVSVSAGVSHSILLDTEQRIWTFGANTFGQLGIGNSESKNGQINLITNLPPIQSIFASPYSHSLALDIHGGVWACGNNNYGQLGFGNVKGYKLFTKIESLPRIKSIATGTWSSIFLDEEGSVWASGFNGNGELALPSGLKHSLSPTKIEGLPPISAIYAKKTCPLFLDVDGGVWMSGEGFRQFGFANIPPSTGGPMKIPNLPAIRSFAAGYCHLELLDVDFNVWTIGTSANGQTGSATVSTFLQKLETILLRVINIECCAYFTVFQCEDDSIWVCGENTCGQLGISGFSGANATTPTISCEFVKIKYRTLENGSRTKSARNVR